MDDAPPEPAWSTMQANWAAWHATPPEVLYHYTTASGLLGMITTGRLWATNALFLNDPTELRYAIKIVSGALSVAVSQYEGKLRELDEGQNFIVKFFKKKLFASQIVQWADNIKTFMNEQENIYISCFCKNDDLLSQWRGYGATGSGYAVGFLSAGIQREPDNPTLPKILLRKVIYDPKHQADIVRERVKAVFTAELEWRNTFERELMAFSKRGSFMERVQSENAPLKTIKSVVEAGRRQLEQGREYFKQFLIECLICFKDPNYVEEDEWRAIYFATSDSEVCFRDANGRVTPYCKLDITKDDAPGKLPIRSIRYGPTLEPKETDRALNMLVRSAGYHHVKPQPSNIRFRTR